MPPPCRPSVGSAPPSSCRPAPGRSTHLRHPVPPRLLAVSQSLPLPRLGLHTTSAAPAAPLHARLPSWARTQPPAVPINRPAAPPGSLCPPPPTPLAAASRAAWGRRQGAACLQRPARRSTSCPTRCWATSLCWPVKRIRTPASPPTRQGEPQPVCKLQSPQLPQPQPPAPASLPAPAGAA